MKRNEDMLCKVVKICECILNNFCLTTDTIFPLTIKITSGYLLKMTELLEKILLNHFDQ